ncbi:hypothetical protein A2U01_0058236 [Trifolium medium]|uniref:Uncharacterized protein n=1 Tax=Trifolium medium TaxID=97028 RepID=A0A392RLD9_9FABA|nr:hypothetical protein [Trifolium medium]
MNNLKKAMPNPREDEEYEEGSRCLGRGWCLILCLKPKLELELELELKLKPNYKGAIRNPEGRVGDNLLRLGLAGRQPNLWRRNGIL